VENIVNYSNYEISKYSGVEYFMQFLFEESIFSTTITYSSIFIIILLSIATLINILRQIRYKELVKKYSVQYTKLITLNNQYSFSTNINRKYVIELKCESKKHFDRTNCDLFICQTIEENTSFFQDIITKLNKNETDYQHYQTMYEELKSATLPIDSAKHRFRIKGINYLLEKSGKKIFFTNADSENTRHEKKQCASASYFRRIEEKYFTSYKLVKPQTSISIKCTIIYFSPKGRNKYQKSKVYSYENVKYIYQYVLSQIENRSTRGYQIKQERSKMNNSIRYDVLKRDNFKCCICGLSSLDGVVLHVDHIIPVSKGGKTELNNLQTLCDRCNYGKTDKY
jgi:Restriction endonuclease